MSKFSLSTSSRNGILSLPTQTRDTFEATIEYSLATNTMTRGGTPQSQNLMSLWVFMLAVVAVSQNTGYRRSLSTDPAVTSFAKHWLTTKTEAAFYFLHLSLFYCHGSETKLSFRWLSWWWWGAFLSNDTDWSRKKKITQTEHAWQVTRPQREIGEGSLV